MQKEKDFSLGRMMPYLVIFKLTFEESFVMFEIAPSNLSKCKLCYKKKNF